VIFKLYANVGLAQIHPSKQTSYTVEYTNNHLML